MPSISAARKTLAFFATCAVAAFSALPAMAADRIPNDTYYKELWYLQRIGAPEAWNHTLGFEGVPVAIIDSGVDIDHPDLKDNIWHNYKEVPGNGIDDDGNGFVDDFSGWNFVDNNSDPRPDITGGHSFLGASHGTINAGIVAARGDNGRGVVGVTWQTSIMALRALNSDGSGDPNDIVRAVNYAVANGAKVISLSFNGPNQSDQLAAALRHAYDSDVFVVAAAGNAPEGGAAINLDEQPLYPVCLDLNSDENFVFGVAAVDDKDKKAAFSNFGAGCVDLSAPGTRILSTQFYRPGNKAFAQPYGGYFNGTSVAAPLVAGSAALLKSLDRHLTPKQIGILLGQAAFPINDLNPGYFGKLGRGRLDIAKAVGQLLASQKSGPTPPPTASLLPAGASDLLYAAAPGAGRATEIRLFTEDGIFVRSFEPFAAGFRGGATLATGDFDGKGRRSLLAGAGPGGGPQVRIFDVNTRAIGGFFAFNDKFRGGVSVAAGDVDGDGRDEVIAGAGPGGGPQVRLFESDGTPIGGFFAFNDKFRGGVSVAAGDVDGDGRSDIAVMSGPGQVTVVRVYNGKGVLIKEFKPFGAAYRRGGTLAMSDVDGDGRAEITAVPAAGAAVAFRGDGTPVDRWSVGGAVIRGAVSNGRFSPVAALSGLAGTDSLVRLQSARGEATSFYAFEPRFRGGVRVTVISD